MKTIFTYYSKYKSNFYSKYLAKLTNNWKVSVIEGKLPS